MATEGCNTRGAGGQTYPGLRRGSFVEVQLLPMNFPENPPNRRLHPRLFIRRLAFIPLLCFTRAMPKPLLAFVDDIYEDLELWYPKLRLEEAGYTTRLVATELRSFTGKHGYPAKADLLLSDVQAGDFDGLLIPGGFMPDKLRRHERVLSLTREMFEAGKLVAFICHGGWIPISAKILRGKKVTSLPASNISRVSDNTRSDRKSVV